MSKQRILVTGASGFLGGHLVRGLGSVGVIRAGLRDANSANTDSEIALVPDLTERKSLRVALQGVQTVVHAAGRAHILNEVARDPLAEYRRANTDTTEALLDEAKTAGVERFVMLSSVAVYGQGLESVGNCTLAAPTTPYGVSKFEAEEAVRSAKWLVPIVLRLPLVYGPGMKGNPLRLFRIVDRGVPVPVGAVNNLRSLLFVGNFVAALRSVLVSPDLRGGTFLVADSRPVSTAELVRLIAIGLNRPARVLRVPLPVLRAIGRAGDMLSRFVPSPLTSSTIERLTGSLVVDTEEFQRVMRFRAPISVEEGIATTAAWYLGAP